MRIVPLKAIGANNHDQVVLLNIVRVAAQGMDFVELERRRAIAAHFMKDKAGGDIADGRNFADIQFLDQVKLKEAEWSEVCRLFTSFRGWAMTDDGSIAALKERLFEARQIEDPAEKPAKK